MSRLVSLLFVFYLVLSGGGSPEDSTPLPLWFISLIFAPVAEAWLQPPSHPPLAQPSSHLTDVLAKSRVLLRFATEIPTFLASEATSFSCCRRSITLAGVSASSHRRSPHSLPAIDLSFPCLQVNCLMPVSPLKGMVVFSSSVKVARSVQRITSMVFLQLVLFHSRDTPEDPSSPLGKLQLRVNDDCIVGWLQDQPVAPIWICCLRSSKSLNHDLLECSSGLMAGKIYVFFRERASSPFSSLWERSFSQSSSDKERTFPSSPFFSFKKETYGIQPEILPLLVDTLWTGLDTRHLSNSTQIEPTSSLRLWL